MQSNSLPDVLTCLLGPVEGLSTPFEMTLGRVTVLCGKNNAGKSTLLRALNQAGHSRQAIPLSESALADICTHLVQRVGNLASVPYESLMATVLLSLAPNGSLRCWDDDTAFHTLYKGLKSVAEVPGRGDRWTPALERLRMEYPPTLYSHHIPADRQIDYSVPIGKKDEITSRGQGLLRELFRIKNQPRKSRDHFHFEELLQRFEFVTEGISFDINEVTSDHIQLVFHNPQGGPVVAELCGQGLQHLLLILYHLVKENYHILTIEEPETGLHPEAIRRLMDVCGKTELTKVVVTTHSNVVASSSSVDRIYVVEYKDGIMLKDVSSRAFALRSLGYSISENLSADLTILVEGVGDRLILERVIEVAKVDRNLDIRFILLGGDAMQHVELRDIADPCSTIAVLDSDPMSARSRRQFIGQCRKLGIELMQWPTYSIENLLPIEAIRLIYRSKVPTHLEKLEPNVRIKDQLGFDIKRRLRDVSQLLDENNLHAEFRAFMTLCIKRIGKVA